MLIVDINGKMSIDAALKKLKSKYIKTKMSKELFERKEYKKKSVERRMLRCFILNIFFSELYISKKLLLCFGQLILIDIYYSARLNSPRLASNCSLISFARFSFKSYFHITIMAKPAVNDGMIISANRKLCMVSAV